jgi:hypothetical protein
MRAIPEFVTFTGADDATPPDRMVEIGRRSPVEWGLLFSRKRQGTGRYPSLGFLGSLRGRGLRLAAHVCGAYADEIVDTGACSDFEGLAASLGLEFERIQINTGRSFDPGVFAAFAARFGARAIAQCRDAFPEDDRVDWLHDVSAGEGLMPSFRPAPGQQVFGGYAWVPRTSSPNSRRSRGRIRSAGVSGSTWRPRSAARTYSISKAAKRSWRPSTRMGSVGSDRRGRPHDGWSAPGSHILGASEGSVGAASTFGPSAMATSR